MMQGASAGRKSISVAFCGSQVISGIPFPPSDNVIYRNARKKDNTKKRIKTEQARDFIADFQTWTMIHAKEIRLAQKWFRDPSLIAVTIILGCHARRLWTLKGEQKKFDCQNRQKIILDCLAKAIGIDDRNFWSVQILKTEIDDKRLEEVSIALRPIIPKQYETVKSLFSEGKNV